jgi:hypothetical protein
MGHIESVLVGLRQSIWLFNGPEVTRRIFVPPLRSRRLQTNSCEFPRSLLARKVAAVAQLLHLLCPPDPGKCGMNVACLVGAG